MTWLLIITITIGGNTSHTPAGIMETEDLCIMAGIGIEVITEGANPGAVVQWTCISTGETA